MPEWINEFQSESITSENRESFNTAMSKYETKDDAIVGGFNAQKLAGKPFKLPESMDKLPDDASRGDFTTQAHKLLGIEHAENIEGLDDIDMKAGMPEGSEIVPNETLTTLLKTLAVEKKWPKSVVQDIVNLYNGPLTKFSQEFQVTKLENEKIAKAKATNEALIAHPDIGSAEELAAQSELLRRAVKNNMGFTAEEYEEFGEELADSMMTKNAVMARGLLKVLVPLAKEGSFDSGAGGGGGEKSKQSPYEYKKARFPKSEGMWGKPADTWETQTISLRKQAGIK